MSNFKLVETQGWEYDLHSVYSGYIDYFQKYSVPWLERSWRIFFLTFEAFLGSFEWPVMTVTDCKTGRPYIVTQIATIRAFLRMIKTNYGDTFPMVENVLHVVPYEANPRRVHTVSDANSYKKLHATLPAVFLAALKVRIRNGELKAIRELWNAKDKVFLAIDFEWFERNPSTCLEWGYATVQCGQLSETWPPDPESHYRRGHYVVSDYLHKLQNRKQPNFPLDYAFGTSQTVRRAHLPQIIQAVISSLASPESETTANNLVLVAHGLHGHLERLHEMKIKLPHNVLMVDTAVFERQLYNAGQRGEMQGPSGRPRAAGSTLSLANLLTSLGLHVFCKVHNSGNDAYMGLLALQLLLEPQETRIPMRMSKQLNIPGHAFARPMGGSPVPSISLTPSPASLRSFMGPSSAGSSSLSRRPPDGYFDQDFSAGRKTPNRSPGHSPGNSPSSYTTVSMGYLSIAQ